MKSLWNHHEITIGFVIFLWIHYLLRDFTMNSLPVSRIHLESVFSLNHYELTICFAISLWIHYLIPKIAMNSRCFSRFHYEFTIVFAKSLWVRFEITWKPLWNQYEFSIFFAYLLSVSRLFHKNHYLLDDFNMNSPQFNLEFTIYFVISLRIHYIYREFILNTRSVSRIYYEFTNLFASHVSHVSHEPITWWCRYDYGMKKSIRNHYGIVAVTLMA